MDENHVKILYVWWIFGRNEQLMMLAPNFPPRRSGIVINNYFNCEGGVKDCNCNLINVRNGCVFYRDLKCNSVPGVGMGLRQNIRKRVL